MLPHTWKFHPAYPVRKRPFHGQLPDSPLPVPVVQQDSDHIHPSIPYLHGRIGEWSENIENCTDSQFFTDRSDIFHCDMIILCEQETNLYLIQ